MKNKLIKSSLLVTGLAIIAKGVGFLKSILQATVYGSTSLTDAYNMAFGVVNDVIYMLTTAIAVAFVPMYIKKKNEEGVVETYKYSSRIISFLGIVVFIFSVVLFLVAPFLIQMIAPSYSGEQLKLTILAFRIMVVGVVFSLETNVFQNILNSEYVYGFSAFASIINSIVLILFILIGERTLGIYALIFAVPVSYFIQFLFLYIKGKKYARITVKNWKVDDSVKFLLLQTLPILISNATVEINQAVDRALLTGIETGAVTAASYAATLFQFVANIINAPISSVLYTKLSEDGAEKNLTSICKNINHALEMLFLISIPITAVVFMMSSYIVQIVYGHGNFSEYAVSQTAEGLAIYGFCIFPVAAKQVFTKAYYSLNDMRRPTIIGICEVITNIVLSVILARYYEIAGVVLGTAVASLIYSLVLGLDFTHRYVGVLKSIDRREYLKILMAGIASAGIIYLGRFVNFNSIFVGFLIKTVMALAVYLGILIILREKTIHLLIVFLKNKGKRV